MKKDYIVTVVDSPDKMRLSHVARINNYAWSGSYRPRARGRLMYVPGDGFYARLTAYEKDPRAVYFNNMDPVSRDSCLEFFATYREGFGYINCEVNANGAILSAYGFNREERTPLSEICGKFPEVSVSRYPDRWTAVVRVGNEILRAVYGDCDFGPGSVIRGNFYKCGDDCVEAHYGAFSPMESETPNFHLPEQFAVMRLV